MLTEKQVYLLNQLNYCDKSFLSTSMEGSSVRTMVTALQKAPFGGAVSYEVMGTVIALRSTDARRIGIKICK